MQICVDVNCCGQYVCIFLLIVLFVNALNFRWRKKEFYDIVMECKKLFLDSIDRIQERGGFMFFWILRQNCQDLFVDKFISFGIFIGSCDSQGFEISRLKERRMFDTVIQIGRFL